MLTQNFNQVFVIFTMSLTSIKYLVIILMYKLKIEHIIYSNLILQFHQDTIVWFGSRNVSRLSSYPVEMEEL